MHLHTGTHVVTELFGMQVNLDTIFTTWLAAIIVILVTLAATRGRAMVPSGIQNAMEMLVEALCNQFRDNIGHKYRQVATWLLTLFLFIFTSNQLGLLPTNHLTASPTNDVNTTLGLAIASSLAIHFYYLKNKGFGHWIGHFFKPFSLFVVMNLVEEVARPIALAMRLFGNILAGNSAGSSLCSGAVARTYDLDCLQPVRGRSPGLHLHHARVHLPERER